MKLDVIDKKENPFLKRTDLTLTVDHKGQATPKKEDLEKEIAKEFKSVPEKVEIIYIFSETGLTKSKIKARVWEEKIVKKKKEEPKKEPEKEEKKEEGPQREPAEKKVEEKKPEEQPKPEDEKKTPKEESKKEQPKPDEKQGEKK